MTTPIHQDVQTGKPLIIWLIIPLVAFLGWWGFITQIILGTPWGTNPAPDIVLVLLWLLLAFILPAFLLSLRLTISVFPDSVRIGYRPIWKARIDLADVTNAEPVTYRPILEWGGWGIRWRPGGAGGGGGWAYTLSGNKGVKLTLRSGHVRLLGSSDPDALAQAILEQLDANDPHFDVSV